MDHLDRQAPPAETVPPLLDPLDTLETPEQEGTAEHLASKEGPVRLEMRDFAEILAHKEDGLEAQALA